MGAKKLRRNISVVFKQKPIAIGASASCCSHSFLYNHPRRGMTDIGLVCPHCKTHYTSVFCMSSMDHLWSIYRGTGPDVDAQIALPETPAKFQVVLAGQG